MTKCILAVALLAMMSPSLAAAEAGRVQNVEQTKRYVGYCRAGSLSSSGERVGDYVQRRVLEEGGDLYDVNAALAVCVAYAMGKSEAE